MMEFIHEYCNVESVQFKYKVGNFSSVNKGAEWASHADPVIMRTSFFLDLE